MKRDLDSIRQSVIGVVMFVDLVGSTEFKSKNPREEVWLPRLATFLQATSRLVQMHGRVVKYIGDEVMAFLPGENAVVNGEHTAEQILAFCSQFQEYRFQVKIALDYGQVSMLDFVPSGVKDDALGKADPHGHVVDRCARIMGRTARNVVLCSKEFRAASQAKQRWRPAGAFKAKGLSALVRVYQLRYGNHEEIKVGDSRLTLEDCIRDNDRLRGQLKETLALRKPISRRRGQ